MNIFSLTIHNGNDETHVSLFPLRSEQSQPDQPNFFKRTVHGILSPFESFPPLYKPNYEQDCIMEGAAHKARLIGAGAQLKKGKKAYHYNKESHLFEEVEVNSIPRASNDTYYRIKPVEANVRVVLYSLDVNKVKRERV